MLFVLENPICLEICPPLRDVNQRDIHCRCHLFHSTCVAILHSLPKATLSFCGCVPTNGDIPTTIIINHIQSFLDHFCWSWYVKTSYIYIILIYIYIIYYWYIYIHNIFCHPLSFTVPCDHHPWSLGSGARATTPRIPTSVVPAVGPVRSLCQSMPCRNVIWLRPMNYVAFIFTDIYIYIYTLYIYIWFSWELPRMLFVWVFTV